MMLSNSCMCWFKRSIKRKMRFILRLYLIKPLRFCTLHVSKKILLPIRTKFFDWHALKEALKPVQQYLYSGLIYGFETFVTAPLINEHIIIRQARDVPLLDNDVRPRGCPAEIVHYFKHLCHDVWLGLLCFRV
jgi:hypothetical protein